MSEQEGEFKKRLTYPFFALISNKVWADQVKQGNPTFPRPTHNQVVQAILDEAAAEFLEVMEGKTNANGEYITTYHDWFVRWFGKPKT